MSLKNFLIIWLLKNLFSTASFKEETLCDEEFGTHWARKRGRENTTLQG